MAVTYSLNKAVYKATAATDTIPAKYAKAMFWVLSAATENTDTLLITEKDTNGKTIYADAAPKTHGAVAIPCPALPVDDFYVKTMGNGYLLLYPDKVPWS